MGDERPLPGDGPGILTQGEKRKGAQMQRTCGTHRPNNFPPVSSGLDRGASAATQPLRRARCSVAHRLPKARRTASMPPATPPAMMTVAMTTRRRTQGIHDHDPSFLNHYVQAARGARISIASIGTRLGPDPPAATAPKEAQQSPAINPFYRLFFLLPGGSPLGAAPANPRAWFSGGPSSPLKSILSTSAYRAWRSRPPR